MLRDGQGLCDQVALCQGSLVINVTSFCLLLIATSSLASKEALVRTGSDWLLCYLQVSAVESLDGPLLQVEGLSDLRLELHSKKLNIHHVLIDELHRHLYIKSTSRLGHKNKDKNAARLPG